MTSLAMTIATIMAIQLAPIDVATGTVTVMVFDTDGGPAENIAVHHGDSHTRTSTDGTVVLHPAAGVVDIVVDLDSGDGGAITLPTIRVRPGILIDVIVVARRSGPPLVEIDGPVADPAEAEGITANTQAIPRAPGRITGTVSEVGVDADGRTPVPAVAIGVRGSVAETTTAADGTFSLQLPPGTWAISVVHAGHLPRVVDGIVVVEGEDVVVDVDVVRESAALDTYVVKTPHVKGSLAEAAAVERDADTITEVLGAEEMSRTGASDAAAALKSVTGVTLVGGRYVYVRGLGERYSSTLLNGATLPSPEPERRVVPLDLFPTAVLDGVVVHKAYSPELPGEFGGGAVELKTRAYPEGLVAQVGISTGGAFGTTFSQALVGHRGGLDVVGIDDGGRALPGPVREASATEPLLERDRFSTRGYKAEQLERFGEAMPNTWGTTRGLVLPDVGLQAQVGNRWTLGDVTLGALAGMTYGNDWQRLTFHRDYFTVGVDNALEKGHAYDFESLENSVQLGALATAGAALGTDHRLTLTSLLGRMTDNETRIYQGRNRDVDGNIRVTRQRFVERTLLAEQALGHHAFPSLFGLEFDWRYTWALALRNEPDTREVRYDEEGQSGLWMLSDRPEGNQRFFSNLTDHSHDLSAVVRLPFQQYNDLPAHIEAGVGVATKDRTVDTRRFKYMHKGPRSGLAEVLGQDPEDVFVPDNIGADGFQFEEITRQTDNYDAQQGIWSAWLGSDIPLWTNLKFAGGVRLEHATQTVRTFALFNPDDEPVVAALTSIDILPAASLTVGLTDTMQLRASGSITVSRPDFRELSPATFNDVTGGRQQFGNPDLQRASIYAVDARHEWFPLHGVEVATGVFYKHFDHPIEQVVVVSAQHSVTYENAIAADNIGVELEVRHDFGWLHESLEGFSVAGNGALIQSVVQLDETSGIQTSNTRALQGQSPWVLNLQAGWENADVGSRIVGIYNVFGPRISNVGASGAPDIYEEPFHRLDLVARQQLAWGLALSFKAENLIDLPQRTTQGGQTIEAVQLGRSLSASLGWSF